MNKFLGQIRPTDTNTTLAISVPAEQRIEINSIFISETSGSSTTFSIYADKTNIDVKTYSQSNALFYQSPIEANNTIHISSDNLILLHDSSCSIAVKVGNANAVTFSFFGEVTAIETSSGAV